MLKHINIGKKPATKETSTYHHTDSLEKKEVILKAYNKNITGGTDMC